MPGGARLRGNGCGRRRRAARAAARPLGRGRHHWVRQRALARRGRARPGQRRGGRRGGARAGRGRAAARAQRAPAAAQRLALARAARVRAACLTRLLARLRGADAASAHGFAARHSTRSDAQALSDRSSSCGAGTTAPHRSWRLASCLAHSHFTSGRPLQRARTQQPAHSAQAAQACHL